MGQAGLSENGEASAKMPLSEADKKRRGQKKWNRKRSSDSHRKDLEQQRCNYHRAKRQRKSLEAIDARAAAGATSEKGTAGTPPLSKESKQPEPIQVSL